MSVVCLNVALAFTLLRACFESCFYFAPTLRLRFCYFACALLEFSGIIMVHDATGVPELFLII
jgi:hypothetical protein